MDPRPKLPGLDSTNLSGKSDPATPRPDTTGGDRGTVQRPAGEAPHVLNGDFPFGSIAGPIRTSDASQSASSYLFLSPTEHIGELGRLGPYRVVRLLGEGGMGFVFRAEDDGLQRPVALKVMRPEVAAEATAKERFLREGRAAAAIQSDHVITIYQVGEANGVPFLAMQYLDGQNLDQWLKNWQKTKNRPVQASAVVRVAKDLLKGLVAAHEKGLIHRDIKPANLWVEAKTSRIKLLDFGLAKADGSDKGLTHSGQVLGTAAYMAPEQARGLHVDARADLFSVGVVLHRMIAGQSPFQQSTYNATIIAIVTEEPPPAASFGVVPDDLAELIDRLLAKRPEDRPASAKAALAVVLEVEQRLRSGLPPSSGVVAVPGAPVRPPEVRPGPDPRDVVVDQMEALEIVDVVNPLTETTNRPVATHLVPRVSGPPLPRPPRPIPHSPAPRSRPSVHALPVERERDIAPKWKGRWALYGIIASGVVAVFLIGAVVMIVAKMRPDREKASSRYNEPDASSTDRGSGSTAPSGLGAPGGISPPGGGMPGGLPGPGGISPPGGGIPGGLPGPGATTPPGGLPSGPGATTPPGGLPSGPGLTTPPSGLPPGPGPTTPPGGLPSGPGGITPSGGGVTLPGGPPGPGGIKSPGSGVPTQGGTPRPGPAWGPSIGGWAENRPPLAGQVKPFYAIAFDVEKGDVYTVSPHPIAENTTGTLRRYAYPNFKLKGEYHLPNLATRAVLDPAAGLLYLASVTNGNPRVANEAFDRSSAIGNVQIFDLNSIRSGTIAQSAAIKPTATVTLNQVINGMELSPDGKSLYVVTSHKMNNKTISTLRWISTGEQKSVKYQELPDFALDMCLSADKKHLLLIENLKVKGAPSNVRVFDTVNWSFDTPIQLPGSASDIAPATGDRFVAAIPDDPATPAISNLYVFDGERTKVVTIPGSQASNNNYVKFTPDSKYLFVTSFGGVHPGVANRTGRSGLQPPGGGFGSPLPRFGGNQPFGFGQLPGSLGATVGGIENAGLDVFKVSDPADPQSYKKVASVRQSGNLHVGGYFHISPDGKYIVFHTGAVLAVERVTENAAAGSEAGGFALPGGGTGGFSPSGGGPGPGGVNPTPPLMGPGGAGPKPIPGGIAPTPPPGGGSTPPDGFSSSGAGSPTSV